MAKLSIWFPFCLALWASRCAQGFATVPPPIAASATSATTATSWAMLPPGILRPSFGIRGGETSLQASATTTNDDAFTETPIPTWESLQSELETIRDSQGKAKAPVLTLYRDTNGWCPFCERVWIAVMAKGLPYQETLVNLQKKPDWFKQMVPTGLVPAVLFHGSEESDKEDPATMRELVWESDAILEELDNRFPETPKLMRKGDPDFDAALEMQTKVQSAGFRFAYGNRNGTMTEDEIAQTRADFDAALDELDSALGKQQNEFGSKPCFRLGEFSGVDCIMVPTLERWRYQLPLTSGVDILENRPHLRTWFAAMDGLEAYHSRVSGDAYSWTATASQFLRIFGGTGPAVDAGIARADAQAEALAQGFVAAGDAVAGKPRAALEAAAKLVANHAAVLDDCFREDPLTQQHLPRAEGSRETAELLLRQVAASLLALAEESNDQVPHEIVSIARPEGSDDEEGCRQAAVTLRTVAKRLSVPRDMGPGAAALLRSKLTAMAEAAERSL